jgi:hypothetical protein
VGLVCLRHEISCDKGEVSIKVRNILRFCGPARISTTTGKAERACTIPTGKAILFPLVDAECSYAEYPKLKTESDLRSCAISLNDHLTHPEAIINGVSLQNQQMPRIQSPLFSFIFPENNLFGASAGPSQSVADGYYVFLQPQAHSQKYRNQEDVLRQVQFFFNS